MDANIIRQCDMILADCHDESDALAATIVAQMMANDGHQAEAVYLLSGLEKIVDNL